MISRPIEAMAVLGAATLMLAACGPTGQTIARHGDDAVKAAEAVRPPPPPAHADAEAGASAREAGRKAFEEMVKQSAERFDRSGSGNKQE